MAYQNFYATKTQSAISNSDTVITVQTPPTVTSGRLVLEPRNALLREIISFTGVSGTQLTGVTRGLYGTAAQTHTAGALVEMNFLAQDYTDLTDAFASFAQTNGSGWYDSTAVFSSNTYNGNHSYTGVTTVDQSSLWAPGMRLRFTNTVATPTQSASLNGTSQYFSKSSPAGMTFTDDFAVGAWVRLSSYPTGNATIVSRFNGTNGWKFYVGSDGTLILIGFNGGVGNASYIQSYQSLPLNKWVHVAAQLDMSSFTGTPTTSYMMTDGVYISGRVVRSGTNPTSLVQAGNLEIGSTNGGTELFPGNIAQVAVYGSKVTQTTMRASISQGLVGTETSLISAYSLSNSLNDLNANANNLTAQGGATTTNASSPFGQQANGSVSSTLNYGIIQAVNGTSVTYQVPEGNTVPTSGGIASVKYATTKSPYGMPTTTGKWTIDYWWFLTMTGTLSTSWNNLASGASFAAPIGVYRLMFEAVGFNESTVVQPAGCRITISDATNTENIAIINRASIYVDKVTALNTPISRTNQNLVMTAQTLLYINGRYENTNTSRFGIDGSFSPTHISLENAYL